MLKSRALPSGYGRRLIVCSSRPGIRGGTDGNGSTTFTAGADVDIDPGGWRQQRGSRWKCEVKVGYQGAKILRIVEEGYLVTEEDVRTNKVIVELDSSDLEKQIVQQEIQYQSAYASLIDAQQNYEIQLNQNQSDIKTAEQKTRFARMDFDKFLGDSVTARIIEEVGLDKLLAAASTNDVEQTLRAEEAFELDNPALPPPRPAVRPATADPATNAPAPVGAQPAVIPRAAAKVMPVPEIRRSNAELAGGNGVIPAAGGQGDAHGESGQVGRIGRSVTSVVLVDFSAPQVVRAGRRRSETKAPQV